MSAPLTASDVVIGLLTENRPRMLVQAIRCVRSIRWFGGEASRCRIVVCGVGSLEAGAHAELEKLGAEIRTVTRFHPASPTGNRHQLIAELLDAPEKVMFLLDCDTIVVQDPLPHLNGDVFQAKIAPGATVTDEVFERLFAHFQLPKPARAHVARLTNETTIPYFNAGVIACPVRLMRTLAPSWRRFNQILADQPELAAPSTRHLHQASCTLALVETGVPCAELPEAMNYQINASGFAEADPVIIHYHHLATEDGFLLPTEYAGAQARIDQFHARMRAEGLAPSVRETSTEDSRAIVVLGMHRSGTSVITEIVKELGSYAGRPDELGAADLFNPTGYWEHREAVQLDNEMLAGVTDEQRPAFVERARRIGQSLRGRGSYVLKDPRMCLLFPIWREALGEPVCVLAWREPLAVAKSLLKRDRQPLVTGLAAWELHTRTMLRDSAGLQRVLISYDALLADPVRVVRELYESLVRFGIRGLSMPSDERIRQIVNPDFNRSATNDDRLLDAEQRALVDDLRSGAVLEGEVAPLAERTREWMAVYAQSEERRREIVELDLLLEGVFESRSWRVGHRLVRLLRRGNAVSAFDRWQERRRRRTASEAGRNPLP